MRELIAELPAQLRWAAGIDPPPLRGADEAVVAGMGGSGIAGTIASVIAEQAGRRVAVHKGYGVPGWFGRTRPLLIAVSHSGNTEETLSSVGAAAETGVPVAAVTTGGRLAETAGDAGWPLVAAPPGPQPRAAVGYLTGGVLRLLEAASIVPAQSADLMEAAAVVEGLLDGPGAALASDIADALRGRVAVIVGGSAVGAAAANRWKTQINENGKAPAFWSELPELDHNEIVGWTAWPELSRDRVGVVWLRDAGDHPRVALRARLTADLVRTTTGIAGEVHATGESALARLFGLIAIGDLVSVEVAERAGVDPMPVDVIEELKSRLAGEGT